MVDIWVASISTQSTYRIDNIWSSIAIRYIKLSITLEYSTCEILPPLFFGR